MRGILSFRQEDDRQLLDFVFFFGASAAWHRQLRYPGGGAGGGGTFRPSRTNLATPPPRLWARSRRTGEKPGKFTAEAPSLMRSGDSHVSVTHKISVSLIELRISSSTRRSNDRILLTFTWQILRDVTLTIIYLNKFSWSSSRLHRRWSREIVLGHL